MLLVQAGVAHAANDGDTAVLFQNACSICHGSHGRGLQPGDPKLLTFPRPPADLTDPMFSSSEPKKDWFQVIKHGGAVLGLSEQMPTFGEALDDQQISALVEHAKGLASTWAYPAGDLNLIRSVVTKKAFPEDEFILLSRYDHNGPGVPDGVRGVAYFGKRLGTRSQGEAKLVQKFSKEKTELDEVEVGFKHALFPWLTRSWLLSAGAELGIPVHFDEEAPRAHGYLAFAKPLGRLFGLQAHAQYSQSIPAGDGATAPADLQIASALHFHGVPTFKRGVYPGIEGKAVVPLSGGGKTQFSVLPQVLAKLSKRGHVALAVGAEIPVANASYDYRVHSFLIWEFMEGLPWEGW
mgnify:CR=1 FL=1